MPESISNESTRHTELPLGKIRQVQEGDVDSLVLVYDEIVSSGAYEFFHPHEMSAEYAEGICRYNKYNNDRYYLWIHDGVPVAYGMMRYFGYDVPSLGIYVCEEFRGKGVGRALMLEMHRQSEILGDNSIRLTVEKGNEKAISLYKSLGYSMQDCGDYLLGMKYFQGEELAEEERFDIEENPC